MKINTRSILPAAIAGAVSTASAATLKVVTTTQDLASIAAAVGGKNATVSALIQGARDPHRLEAKPSFMSKVSNADLFIAVGLELEVGYEKPILTGSRNAKVAVGAAGHVYASEYSIVLEKPTGTVTRAMGDMHPYGNPHIWLDPYNARSIALKLGEKMAALNASDAAAYRSNAKVFADKLDDKMFGAPLVNKYGADKLWTLIRNKDLLSTLREQNTMSLLGGWVGRMAPYVNSNVVTYHRSWSYFINRFGLVSVGELEPKPGIDPTPSHLAKVIDIVKQSNVKAILQEPYYSTRNAEFVASRTNAKVVVCPGSVGHESAASDYFALMDTIVNRVSSALSR
jgi:ABC-type Zn uptake system ZnuABC Zn-binding protein ZnuA